MSENNETIADIVAQIRAAAYIQTADTPRSILQLADRIAAAAKREKAEVEALALSVGGMVEASRHKQVGNSAAMREALEMMCSLFDKGVICTSYANTQEEMEQIEELYRKAKAALAAPARNLERFRDWDEAEAEYLRLVAEGKVEDGTWCEWLFSTGPYAECRAMYGAEHEGNAEGGEG